MLPGTTVIKIMCVHQRYQQGYIARPHPDHLAYTLSAEPTKQVEPVSRDQIFRRERVMGGKHVTCSADHEQDLQPYPVGPYFAESSNYTYVHFHCMDLRWLPCSFFLLLFFNLTYSRWTSSSPSCLWSLRIFPSLPGSRLTIFYRDASSALLQLVNQWLNFTYSRSHAFRYERKNTNPTLVRIELTTSALRAVTLSTST